MAVIQFHLACCYLRLRKAITFPPGLLPTFHNHNSVFCTSSVNHKRQLSIAECHHRNARVNKPLSVGSDVALLESRILSPSTRHDPTCRNGQLRYRGEVGAGAGKTFPANLHPPPNHSTSSCPKSNPDWSTGACQESIVPAPRPFDSTTAHRVAAGGCRLGGSLGFRQRNLVSFESPLPGADVTRRSSRSAQSAVHPRAVTQTQVH
ncbi:uncharacterized protein B0T15DRAFT_237793 [Chaetomium strumarium]|uniref:Uncharacterized protein n=1 Tax=Chaetomium strumarium TaxID=1170767 RepID=A0AAJ0GQL9_9PEZI|nr:hypothetical protein B0T15DRAFT_237793 [Chaetomium strumarium]